MNQPLSLAEVSFLRDETRADAWPYIQLSQSYSDRGYELTIENKGVGPARLKYVDVTIDDEVIEDLDAAILNAVGPENAFSYDLYRTSSPAPGVMSADESTNLFSVPWQKETRLLARAWANRVDVIACYCSIYDDCWIARLSQDEPEPVNRCPAKP